MYPLLLYLPYFNPRSHEGSDETGNQAYIDSVIFQSTLPRGERRQAEICLSLTWIFQSTLPRGERRAELQALETVQAISIHAPTRGATGDSRRPAVGNFYFNPRSHEGSDHYPFLLKLPRSHISIHAPTRGATFSATQTIQIVSNFNPRSHEGSD